jgi:hypothetical protein
MVESWLRLLVLGKDRPEIAALGKARRFTFLGGAGVESWARGLSGQILRVSVRPRPRSRGCVAHLKRHDVALRFQKNLSPEERHSADWLCRSSGAWDYLVDELQRCRASEFSIGVSILKQNRLVQPRHNRNSQ